MNDVVKARFETLGWAIAYACASLDSGEDIREITTGAILEEAEKDLGWVEEESDPPFKIACPDCNKELFTVDPGHKIDISMV